MNAKDIQNYTFWASYFLWIILLTFAMISKIGNIFYY